jgi:hypothetical protein
MRQDSRMGGRRGPAGQPAVYDRVVAEALAGQSGLNPVWQYAVVFRTAGRPLRLGINEGRDLDLFEHRWQAMGRLLGEQGELFADPELWARGKDGWFLEIWSERRLRQASQYGGGHRDGLISWLQGDGP